MRRILAVVCIWSLASGFLSAQTSRDDAISAEIDRLMAECDAQMDEIRRALDAAGEDDDVSGLFDRFRALPGEYIPRIRALTEKARGTEADARGTAWIIGKTRDTAERNALIDRMFEELGQSSAMAKICETLSYTDHPQALELLDALISTSPHREVVGAAAMALAVRLVEKAGRRRDPPPEDRARIEALLKRVIAEFPDLPYFYRGTLGDAARGLLFRIQRVRIGMPVPDIVGEDLLGVPFRLSDYRGRVIMLDFWGHW